LGNYIPPAPGAFMPRQSGVMNAALDPQPSHSPEALEPWHLKRRNFAIFGKSVPSGNAITSKGTDTERLQSRQVTNTPSQPIALRRRIVGGFAGSRIVELSWLSNQNRT
jgi:hypothetical protein